MTFQPVQHGMFGSSSRYEIRLQDNGVTPGLTYSALILRMDGTMTEDPAAQEEAADAQFQRLVDLLATSGDFTISSAAKIYDSSAQVSATQPEAAPEE